MAWQPKKSGSYPVGLEIVLGDSMTGIGRPASIVIEGITIFSEIVYDNPENPAEQNILTLFAARLRRLIEDGWQ